jgi:DNA polymerase III delta prime subunit
MLGEKNKPKLFEEVCGNRGNIKSLRRLVEGNNMPHLLFFGEPGTCKTSTAFVLLNEIKNLHSEEPYSVYIDASKGLDVDKIEIGQPPLVWWDVSSRMKLKFYLIDNAESLDEKTQRKLLMPMEQHSANCKFILICNDKTKLIPALKSRCLPFQFKLNSKEIAERLTQIAKMEGVKISEIELENIAKEAENDFRTALNWLEEFRSDKL